MKIKGQKSKVKDQNYFKLKSSNQSFPVIGHKICLQGALASLIMTAWVVGEVVNVADKVDQAGDLFIGTSVVAKTFESFMSTTSHLTVAGVSKSER